MSNNENFITQITIPKFITKVQVSKKRRAKYYNKYKGKGVKKKVPKKYRGDDYKYNKNGYLVDEHGARVIANPRTAGKPRYMILSGNRLLSGYGSPHVRAKLVRELKNFYRPFVQEHIREHGQIKIFPIHVQWDLYTTVEEPFDWDVSNLFFYYKYFEDCLFEQTDENDKHAVYYKGEKLRQMIPDDSIKYVTSSPGPTIIPVDNWEDRKFIFKFYHDDRKQLQRKPWVQD